MHKESFEQEYYPFHMSYLPECFYQKAAEELNETPETRKEELLKLMDLISADKSTADIKFEEDFLHIFLRHSKYNSLKTFQFLQSFIQFRSNHNCLFQRIQDENLKSYTPSFFSVLPYRCPDGCAIILIELGKWNPNVIPFDDFKRMGLAVFLQLLRCPMTQISGFKIVYDFKDTVKYISYCTPQNLSLFYNAAFNCIPGRYKEVHIINKSLFLTAFWSVIRYALSENIRKRVLFHSSPEDLLNHFPGSIIPTQYGGSLDDYHDSELWRKLSKDHGNCPPGGQANYY